MELVPDIEPKFVWCLVAQFAAGSANASGKILSADDQRAAKTFAAGEKLYCFPPVSGNQYEKVKAVGRHRRSGKYVESIVSAECLEKWKPERVRDSQLMELVAPWDGTDLSREVAEGLAQWKTGGPWPANELRDWNRSHAMKQIGPGTLTDRVKDALGSLFRRARD